MRLLAWCVLLLGFGVSSVCAQPVGVALQPEPHGWMGVPSLDDDEVGSGVLLHLPPRGERAGISGPTVEPGTARSLRVLASVPLAVTSWDRRVYLLFAEWADRLEVFSIRVLPAGSSGAWLTDPFTGASAEPTLELEGAEFVEAAASAEGLLVLGRSEADDAWHLWRLRGREWASLVLPEEVAPGAAVRLVRGSALPTVVVATETGAVRWVLSAADGSEAWSSESLAGSLPAAGVQSVFVSGGDVCAAVATGDDGDEPGGLEVRALGPKLVGRIASVQLAGRLLAVTPLESGGRLAVLSMAEGSTGETGENSGVPLPRWEIIELSLVTGRELYRGPVRRPTLAVGDELRFLSLGMMVLTGFVLLYLLRPVEEEASLRLPEGFALATPGRRWLAGCLDAALLAWPISVIFGVPLVRFLLVPTLFDDARGVLAFAALVAVGAVYGTLAEWLTGRTLGKWLLGMRVVSVDPRRPQRRRGIGLMRSGARNVFRWALAPWAIFGMGSPDTRHRGDRLTGAAVVVTLEKNEDEG